jgi:DNA-binding NarL/FixJ family response regulator
MVFRPAPARAGYALDFVGARGLSNRALEDWRGTLQDASADAFLFDPTRPDARQRNVVHELPLDDERAARGARPGLVALGLAQTIQTRVLVCDGPVLLAFIGVYRERDMRMTEARRETIRRFALEVRPALRRIARISPKDDALDVVLDAVEGDAYLVRPNGGLVHANTVGAQLLTTRRAQIVEAISRTLQTTAKEFDVRPIVSRGAPKLLLLTRARQRTPGFETRLEQRRRDWSLTPRQVAVLERLGLGESNKEIAGRLELSERTVEIHVTALLRKARVDSRLSLVVRLWQGC